MAETVDMLIGRIESALARIEAARVADAAAATKLRNLELVVEASIAELDALMEAQ